MPFFDRTSVCPLQKEAGGRKKSGGSSEIDILMTGIKQV
jgi:hypothetical protein